ncbi:unnamed protein product [Closterium sp. Yama58-4]|nr:unnamed protein product [Closterium sp. Yama58-4]
MVSYLQWKGVEKEIAAAGTATTSDKVEDLLEEKESEGVGDEKDEEIEDVERADSVDWVWEKAPAREADENKGVEIAGEQPSKEVAEGVNDEVAREERDEESAAEGSSDPWKFLNSGDNQAAEKEIEDLLEEGAIVIGREVKDGEGKALTDSSEEEVESSAEELGKGKRVKKPNPRYAQLLMTCWKDIHTHLLLSATATDLVSNEGKDLHILALLPSLTHLSVSERISQFQPRPLPSPPFSFAHLPSLKSLDLGSSCPPFDVMFPSESPCSLLERLTLSQCDELASFPNDLEDRLPCLRELTISECRSFFEQPQQLTSLTNLRRLKLSDCSFAGLPHDFGELPALKTLVLHKLNVDLPASCSQLKTLETLLVTDCAHLRELPEGFGALTALKTLCLAGSPPLILPDDIGDLTNLQTLFLKSYQQRHLLPSSFTHLASLTRLELQDCALAELPEAMGELRCLRELYIQSCSHLQKLSDSVSALLGLEILKVDSCSSLFSVPRSCVNLTRLKELELTGCGLLRKAPEFLPASLEALSVGCLHQVTRLPGVYHLPCFEKASLYMAVFPSALSRSLSSLEHLKLYLAWEEEFPFPLTAFPHLRTLSILNTGVLKLPDFSRSSLQELRQLAILLPELTELPPTIAALRKLTYMEVRAPKVSSLPDSLMALTRLCKLILSDGQSLTHLPASLTQLSCLCELRVHQGSITCLPPNFSRLSRLQILDLEDCKELEALPEDLGELKLLMILNARGCDKLHDDEGQLLLPEGCNSYRWRF